MYPELFRIGPLPIHTYGFLIAVGFIIAVYVTRWQAERYKMDVERVLDLMFWALLVGFVGARVLFIITRWQDYRGDLLGIFRVWEGGLVFLGGPILGTPFIIWFTKKHKLSLWGALDAVAPGFVIAHAFGRMGCLAAGCCYGRPTGGSWGIRLDTELVDAHLRGIPLHPTQLYESVSLAILFGVLVWLSKRRKFEGQVALTYFMAYPVLRSIVEIYRGDVIRGFVIDGWLSTSQFLSIFVFAIAAVAMFKRATRRGR